MGKMPKPTYSAPSNGRSLKEGKSAKKRKFQPQATTSDTSLPSNEGKRASRLQLEDIFSSIPTELKDRKEEGEGERLKKRKSQPCSAGSLSSNKASLEDVFSQLPVEFSKKLKEGTVGKEGKVGNEEEVKVKKKPKLSNEGKVSALDLLTSPITTTTTTDFSTSQAITRTKNHQTPPRPTVPQHKEDLTPVSIPTSISTQIDPTSLLKQFKQSLRTLSVTLTNLSIELELIDRIWYKNASQFKSAFWWVSFNSSRQSLHKLLLPSPHFQLGLGRETINYLTLLYAGLGGGLDGIRIQRRKVESGGWSTLPKFDGKPSTATIHEFLLTREAIELIKEAERMLETMEQVLQEVKLRTKTAGKILVSHMNTPPAPTFAPLVSAILAMIANIHSLVQVLVEEKVNREVKKGETREKISGVIAVLTDILEGLNSSNIQSDGNAQADVSLL